MIVDAEVWYWTPEGMRRNPPPPSKLGTRYITVADAERLLEEAHRRGAEQARATTLQAESVLRR